MVFQFKVPAAGQPTGAATTPLERAVHDLAHDLQLVPIPSPLVQKGLHHFVSALHPTLGSGGMLHFELVAAVSRAVLDNSIARYGQVNLEDEAVMYAGSPLRLLHYYRTKVPDGNFNPNVSLEGASGNTPKERDAYWRGKNEEFERKYLLVKNFLTDASITTLAVMRAIPAHLLGDVTEERVKEVGDEIAARLTAQGYPVNLLTHSEARRLVAEKQEEAAAAAAGAS
jgi:hypothetical protein